MERPLPFFLKEITQTPANMNPYRLYLFGPPRLETNDRRMDLNLKKALALLAYLAVTGKSHTRDALTALFWPESTQNTGRASLRRTLHRIRQAAGSALVAADGDALRLDPSMDLWVDVLDFNSRLAAVEAVGTTQGDEETNRLSRAAAIYSDDFLAGFHLADCDTFDEWQFFQGERLQRRFAGLLDQLIRRHMAAGAYEAALSHAHRRVTLDPLDESAHRVLIRLYGLTGQKGAAVRQFRACRRRLERDLGVTPQKETLDLIASIQHTPGEATIERLPQFPKIRYAKSGDLHIAYQIVGGGPVDLLFVSGFVSHLELIWEEPDLAAFLNRLGGMARLILFDRRGVGLSDRIGYPPSLDDTLLDIHAVMDAAGSCEAVMMGISEGGPAISLFAATAPEKVKALIIYGSMAKGTRTTDYPWVLRPDQYDRWLADLVARWSEGPGIDGFAPTRLKDRRFCDWWARLLRFGSSPGMVRSVLGVLRDIDIRHVLPSIQAPTLVLHRKDDLAIRAENGRYLARHIPGAVLRELEGSDHLLWVGDTEAALVAIQEFLIALRAPAAPQRVLATLCFGEITGESAGGTEDGQKASIESALAPFGGRLAAFAEGRFLATFDSPSRALAFAEHTLATGPAAGLSLRLGLHTGECTLQAGRPAGPAVQVAGRVMDLAGVGEAWVTQALTLLATGSSHRFEDAGQRELAGVTGSWRLLRLKPGRSSRRHRGSEARNAPLSPEPPRK